METYGWINCYSTAQSPAWSTDGVKLKQTQIRQSYYRLTNFGIQAFGFNYNGNTNCLKLIDYASWLGMKRHIEHVRIWYIC